MVSEREAEVPIVYSIPYYETYNKLSEQGAQIVKLSILSIQQPEM